MSDIITTLHPDNDETTNLYPNIKKENIPDGAIDRSKLDASVIYSLNAINESIATAITSIQQPKYYTSLPTSDVGLIVYSDGYLYSWNGTAYVNTNILYNAVSCDAELSDTSINAVQNRVINKKVISYDNLNFVKQNLITNQLADYIFTGFFNRNGVITTSLSNYKYIKMAKADFEKFITLFVSVINFGPFDFDYPLYATEKNGVFTPYKLGNGIDFVDEPIYTFGDYDYVYINLGGRSSYSFKEYCVNVVTNNDLKNFLLQNYEYTLRTPTSTTNDGFWSRYGTYVQYANCTTEKYEINPKTDIAKIKGKIWTPDVPLVCFFDNDDKFMGYEFQGSQGTEVDSYVNIPLNCKYIVINKYNVGSYYNVITFGTIKNSIENNYWKGKKILWLGTSIPATPYEGGQAYPQIVGTKIGADITNNARSGSHAGIQFINGSGAVYSYPWTLYALSYTKQEIQDLLSNWDNIKSQFSNAPETMDQATIDVFKSYSYENLIDPYLTGDDKVDLIVFDHGFNDASHAVLNPDNLFDRTTFQGAMNYLIKHIYEVNPRARICMISNYENQEYTTLIPAQEWIANYWSIDLFRLDKKLGWSNKHVNTKHNWNNGYYESTELEYDTTIQNAWLADGIHPNTDKSGEATNLIANAITPWIKTVV